MRSVVYAEVLHVAQIDRDVGVVGEVGVRVTAALCLDSGIVLHCAVDNLGHVFDSIGFDDRPGIGFGIVDVESTHPVDFVQNITGVGNAVRSISTDVVETGLQRAKLAAAAAHLPYLSREGIESGAADVRLTLKGEV